MKWSTKTSSKEAAGVSAREIFKNGEIASAGKAEEARKFAEIAHEGQFDRGGVPYIEHPKAVASRLGGEVEKIVAWLHDVVEDTEVTVDELRELFGDEVADAVAILSRNKNEPYMDYIRKIKSNEIARKVKMADLSHNMDVSRLPIITDADWKRVEKYKKAYELLSED